MAEFKHNSKPFPFLSTSHRAKFHFWCSKPRGCHCGGASGKWAQLARSHRMTGANSTEKFRIETIQATVVFWDAPGWRETRKGWLQGHRAGFHSTLSTPNMLHFVWPLSPVQGWKSFPRWLLRCRNGRKTPGMSLPTTHGLYWNALATFTSKY